MTNLTIEIINIINHALLHSEAEVNNANSFLENLPWFGKSPQLSKKSPNWLTGRTPSTLSTNIYLC